MRALCSLPLFSVVALLAGGCASRSDVADDGVGGGHGGAPLGGGSPDQVVATVLGERVTLGELDALAKNEITKARLDFDTALYEARKARLDALVDSKVIAAEAKKRGVSEGELLRQEVDGKVPEPDEAALRTFYNDYQDRMEGAAFDEIKDRIKEFLMGESKRTRRSDFIAELRKAHGASVTLEPVRVVVDGRGPTRGAAKAKVQVVVFADFECPYCAQTAPTLDKLEEAFRGDVAIVFRHYPLSFHPSATPAAEASACADEQKHFWDVHDQLFGHKVALDPQAIRGYLQGLAGFDIAAWDACMADGRGQKVVAEDVAAGERAGVDGTPAFFVNGIKLGGARPYEDFEAVVKDELARLGR